MNREEENRVIVAMIKYGGGFVHNLGKAWAHADEYHRTTLRAAFADIYQEYRAQFVKVA